MIERYEISKRQEQKLVKLASLFFPEYTFMYVLGKQIFFHHTKKERTANVMHWYEFVMTHLAERIINPDPDKPNRGIIDRFKDFYWNMNLNWWTSNIRRDPKKAGKHPVDYLYDEAIRTNLIKEK